MYPWSIDELQQDQENILKHKGQCFQLSWFHTFISHIYWLYVVFLGNTYTDIFTYIIYLYIYIRANLYTWYKHTCIHTYIHTYIHVWPSIFPLCIRRNSRVAFHRKTLDSGGNLEERETHVFLVLLKTNRIWNLHIFGGCKQTWISLVSIWIYMYVYIYIFPKVFV